MRIYHNIGSEAEIISDSYKFTNLFEDTVVQVQSRMVVLGDVEVDVGCGSAFGGKNEDEEQGGAGGAPVEKVNDILDGFKYEVYGLDKGQFKTYIGAYLKAILPSIAEKTPNRVAAFKKGASEFAKFIVSKWDDMTIYTPSDNNTDNALIYSYYVNESDEAPVFLYLLEGLPFYKV